MWSKAPGVTGPASLLLKVRAGQAHLWGCGPLQELSIRDVALLHLGILLPSHEHPSWFRVSTSCPGTDPDL